MKLERPLCVGFWGCGDQYWSAVRWSQWNRSAPAPHRTAPYHSTPLHATPHLSAPHETAPLHTAPRCTMVHNNAVQFHSLWCGAVQCGVVWGAVGWGGVSSKIWHKSGVPERKLCRCHYQYHSHRYYNQSHQNCHHQFMTHHKTRGQKGGCFRAPQAAQVPHRCAVLQAALGAGGGRHEQSVTRFWQLLPESGDRLLQEWGGMDHPILAKSRPILASAAQF